MVTEQVSGRVDRVAGLILCDAKFLGNSSKFELPTGRSALLPRKHQLHRQEP